jgi:hypothetical protein
MDSILSVAGVTTIIVFILTLLFQYLPGLRQAWAGVKSEFKMLSVLGMYLVFGAIVAFGGCLDFLAQLIPTLLCSDAPTFLQYLFAVAVAVGAGQGVFSLMPELKEVQAIKSERPY